tara:strand:+ start:89 stop:397 length:309 start_codon:yes stop_codon:yes gene_type:complete
MSYIPEVNDYVIWDEGKYGVIEGWVYFKCPPLEERKGFTVHQRYITIETGVKPKPSCTYSQNDNQHEMIHTLVLCFESNWNQLKFVKKRKCQKPSHYSECEN